MLTGRGWKMKLATWVPKEVDHQGLDKEGREVVLEAKGVQGVAVDLGDSLEEGAAVERIPP